VLFQHQHLANLPDKVKALIHTSIAGRDLSPADYDQLFRIAKKIEALPPGAAADYANKITGSTTDLSAFEAAIKGHRSELAGRQQADTNRTAVQNKLLGLEDVYKLYRQYTATSSVEQASPMAGVGTAVAKHLGAKVQTAGDMREQLEQQLPRYGFASIAEFATYLAKFEQAFEDGAVRITLDILAKYAGKLYRESQALPGPGGRQGSARQARRVPLAARRVRQEHEDLLRGGLGRRARPRRRTAAAPRQRRHARQATDAEAAAGRAKHQGSQGER